MGAASSRNRVSPLPYNQLAMAIIHLLVNWSPEQTIGALGRVRQSYSEGSMLELEAIHTNPMAKSKG